jgi:GT2 family glycosyltransferase
MIFSYSKKKYEKIIQFHEFRHYFIQSYEIDNKKEVIKDCIIDIILPVYNGIGLLKILLPQIINNSDLKYRLIIINDCSPDVDIKPFLESYSSYSNIEIIHNDFNLGFTASVNKGILLSENHVVLLNSDTEVPKNWLSRLIYPIINDDKVATVTPFSNCATILSFPKMDDNPIFENLSIGDIDNIFFNALKPNTLEIPCGVGFCMAINKKTIKEIGILDEIRFAKGYGEEVDFCRRAIKKGYKNVLITNLFVYHKHGGSFDPTIKSKLLISHQKTIDLLYPKFVPDVLNFIKHSILNEIRVFLLLISCSKVAKESIIYFDHELGGGANQYTDRFVEENKNSNLVIVLSFIHPLYNPSNYYAARYYYKDYEGVIHFDSMAELEYFFNYFISSKIIIGSLITFRNTENIMNLVKKIILIHKCKVSYLIHDYHSVCPNFNLLYSNETFCNIPLYEKCSNCLKKIKINPYLINDDFTNISNYRLLWLDFLSNFVDEIICFTSSAKNILLKAYSGLDTNKIMIIPHKVFNYKNETFKLIKTNSYKQATKKEKIVIGILGHIHSDAKGLKLIYELSNLINKNKYNIELFIIGKIPRDIKTKKIKSSGFYNIKSLHNIITENKVNAFFIPSIWPETYSYTTAESIISELPVFCFNLGGQADQTKNYERGILIDDVNAQGVLDAIIKYPSFFQWVN